MFVCVAELHKIGTPGYAEPLAMPTITLTSLEAGTVKVGQYQPRPVHVLNRTLDSLDFRDFMYIEPESEQRPPGAGLCAEVFLCRE